MSGFNIQDFKSIFDRNGGLKRISHFQVEFPVPRSMVSVVNPSMGSSSSGLMSFYCKSASLPGIGILSSDVHRYGYGPIERKPYGTVVNDAMLAMYVDGNNRVREWFNHWTRSIINTHTKKGMGGTSSEYSVTNANAYEINYKTEYAVDLQITAYTPEGKPTTKVVLNEAWPNYIGDIMLDWEGKNTHMIMPISMTYRDWYEDTIKSPPIVQVIDKDGLPAQIGVPSP
jgi:hypothetical protein